MQELFDGHGWSIVHDYLSITRHDQSMLARSIDGCANDESIDWAAWLINHADPWIAHNIYTSTCTCKILIIAKCIDPCQSALKPFFYSVCSIQPFTTQSPLLMTLAKKPFENIVGKGENAGNQHFLLFPQCFLPILYRISIFKLHLLFRLQMLSIWTRPQFVVW